MSARLETGAKYRILTNAGRVWERVQYDGVRRVFVTQWTRNEQAKVIPLYDVERISPRAHDREGSGGAPYRAVQEWVA